MSELATLARPYAEAVFDSAQDSKTTEEWSEMLAFLAVVMSDERMTGLSNNPKVSQEQLTTLMQDICGKQLNPQGTNLLKLLIENRRLTLLPEISRLFEESKADAEGYVGVSVKTAFELTKAEAKKLAEVLEIKLNKKVHLEMTIDKSLIGGFLVQAGDTVIDGSIKGHLQQLANRL